MKRWKWLAAAAVMLLGGAILAAWSGGSAPPGGKPPAAFDPEGFYLNASLRQGLRKSPALWGPPLQERSLAGRVVVVAYFASWCMPCRSELAHLKALDAAYGARGLAIVAVNYFEDFDGLSNDRRLAAFLKQMNLPFPVVKGEAVMAQVLGPVTRIPTVLLFDRQGRLATRLVNTGPAAMEPSSLERRIAALL